MNHLLVQFSIMLVPGLLAIMLHEVAHGYVADRLGDPTARMLGRLTLNPLKHLDRLGLAVLFLVGFGWAKPVPVNPLNFKRPRKDMVWVSLAGPLTNLLLAGCSALILRIMLVLPEMAGPVGTQIASLREPLILMAGFSLYINLLLAALNLIPVPPLDGGRVMTGVLPETLARQVMRVEPFGFVIVLLLIFVTPLWSQVVLPAVSRGAYWLAGPQSSALGHLMPLAGS